MAGFRIPEQVIEEIKASSELVSVVEQYVRLEKKTGQNFFGLCPFHSEDTPSFSVSPSKQIFYCFGCHKGGDVIRFIMEIEKCEYLPAIQLLAQRAGITLPEPDDEAYRLRSEKTKALQAINLEAARFYYQNLISTAGRDARAYLQKRQISAQTVRRFGLGCALADWDGLYRHLQNKGLADDVDLLLQSGLLRRGKSGNLYDLFRERLMFPILDVMGRVVAFGGRVYDDSVPKYINSPETPIYTKGRHLYGLNLAKSSKAGRLLMVEGYMDVIALYQAGIDYTVAALGTAMTENQARLLAKYSESVIIAFDADAAGQTAALRSLDILHQHGLKVTVLQVPEGKDPDEFIRNNGSERFQALIEQSLPLLDFKLLAARREHTHDGALDILAYQDEACDVLGKEENAIVRELYAGRLADELSAMPETVLREIERRRSQKKSGQQHDQLRQTLLTTRRSEPAERHAPATRDEIYLLTLLASDPAIWPVLDPGPVVEDFSEGSMQTLAAAVLPLAADGRLDMPLLLDQAQSLTVMGQPLADLLAQAGMKQEERFGQQGQVEAAVELLKRQRRGKLMRRKDVISQAIMTADPLERDRLKQELLEISQQLEKMKSTSQ
ncbi:MAG: DNA primase [Eubacteriales bacterium]|nr:DNA primase [Eubacteriales bacterium]